VVKGKPLRCPSCGSKRSQVIDSRVEPLTLKDQLTVFARGTGGNAADANRPQVNVLQGRVIFSFEL
jgi:hypothetical protein